jgi:hypothetical protein
MGIKPEKRGCYALKTYGNYLYTWCPETPTYNSKKSKLIINNPNNPNNRKYYCTATPGSQGEDWISTYSYDISSFNGVQERIAYVECDYVQ